MVLKHCKIQKTGKKRIHEQLTNSYIKLLSDKYNNCGPVKNLNLVLKLSGMWESHNECGITFRFYAVSRPL